MYDITEYFLIKLGFVNHKLKGDLLTTKYYIYNVTKPDGVNFIGSTLQLIAIKNVTEGFWEVYITHYDYIKFSEKIQLQNLIELLTFGIINDKR